MGVRGFQSFLKKNSNISTKTDLHDTTLVIDANNLLCAIFCDLCFTNEHKRSDLYGGDLVIYCEAVRDFFKSLEKCCITPILVFDGSVIGKKSTQDQVVLKETEVYRRSLQRFQNIKTAAEDNHKVELIIPGILGSAFRNIVSDLDIQSIQTPYEADAHIARVACDLQCPVLTNDSDFLIYCLPKGFFMFDLFQYKSPKRIDNKRCSITCVNYSQQGLTKYIPGLRSENMPLLSILLGNDYVEAGTFDRVLEIILPKGHYNGALRAENFAHRKIAKLLYWLQEKSSSEAIETILSHLLPANRDKVRNVIKILLRNYKIEETDNLDKELEEQYPPSKADLETSSCPENLPPAFLRRQFKHDLDPIALDMIFHNTYYNYAQLDDFQLQTSSYVKYRPFSLALTLLRPVSYQSMTTYQRQIVSERDAFIIYDREREEYVKFKIKPLEELDGFGSIMYLCCYNAITLEPALKKSMLMSAFRFNQNELTLLQDTLCKVFTDDFLHESVTCFTLIKYIFCETKMNPKPQFVDALMLTLFYYAALHGKLHKEVAETSEYGQVLLKLRPHSTTGNEHKYKPSQTLYRRIMHFISQLQNAYIAYRLLNSLLDTVLPRARFDKFLNGTLIFRLTKLLRLKELTLDTLCGELPTLVDVCGAVRVMVHCEE